MLIQNHKLIKNLLGGHGQVWVWLVWLWNCKIDCISKQMEQTDFLPAVTN